MSKILEVLHGDSTIPREELRRWMSEPDLETRAVVYRLTSEAWDRIVPEPTAEEQCAFMCKYLLDCIVANRLADGYVHSGFEAAWEFAAWFRHVAELPVSETIIRSAVAALETVYHRADADARNRVETGAVEHILERQGLRKYFQHWRGSAEFRSAYQACLAWAEAHES